MICGIKIGPMPVRVHDRPVAIRRFSLKYVFKASELADELIPDPAPVWGFFLFWGAIRYQNSN